MFLNIVALHSITGYCTALNSLADKFIHFWLKKETYFLLHQAMI